MLQFKDILNRYFDRVVLRRGYVYYLDNKVRNLVFLNNKVIAEVKGTKLYKVDISFDKNLVPVYISCTCPYAESENCKHAAAVFYAVEEKRFFQSGEHKYRIKKYFETHPLEIIRNEYITEPSGKLSPEELQRRREEYEKEIERKNELAKFNEFKLKLENLLPSGNNKNHIQYVYSYAFELLGHRTRIYFFKQRLNKNGILGQFEKLSRPNLNTLGIESSLEKLFINHFTLDYNSNDIEFSLYNLEKELTTNKIIFNEFLHYMSDKKVYLYDLYKVVDKEKLFISSKKVKAELFLEDFNDDLILKLGFFEEETKANPGTFQKVVLDDPLWALFDRTIYKIDNLNYFQLNTFFDNKNELKVSKQYLQYFESAVLPGLSFDLNINSSKYHVIKIEASPQKRLYLEQDNTNLVIKLIFSYSEYELPYEKNRTRTSIFSDQKIIQIKRDEEYEENASREVKQMHVKQIDEGVFIPRNNPIDFLFTYLPMMREFGFEIFGEDKLSSFKVNTANPSFKFNISSGINWFDVDTNISYNESTVSFEELLSAIKQNKSYVKLNDGSLGMLPAKWLKLFKRTFSFSEVQDSKLRFSLTQANALDLLLREADETESDEKFKEHLKELNSFDRIQKQELPKTFKGELRDYQISGFDWFYFLNKFGFGGILADDMGLGKTIQVLALLLNEKEKGITAPSLVVAPTSVVFNWIKETERFAPALRVLNHTGSDRFKENGYHFDNYDYIITSYSILLRDQNLFNQTNFHYLILDESQKVKNPYSITSRMIKTLKAENRLCLTGTPVENNLTELWSQISFLNPGMLGSINKFQETFARSIQSRSDDSAANNLKHIIYPFILRRTKELVAKELPPKTEMIQYCEMEEEQRNVYDIWKESLRNEILKEVSDKGIKRSGFKIIEGLLRLRQICNHPQLVKSSYKKKSGKFEEFKEMITEVVQEGHKVLVFSQFVQMLEIIKDFFDKEGIEYEKLTGSTKDREVCINNFQENKDVKVFLISLKAGGFGLNLTAADYVFHYDPWWNPAVEMQATDRAHRIGQDKNVMIYKFITRDSVEEKILLLQDQKRNLVEKIITSESSILKDLTREDIEALFS